MEQWYYKTKIKSNWLTEAYLFQFESARIAAMETNEVLCLWLHVDSL